MTQGPGVLFIPVEAVDEVSDVIRKDDPVLAHVPMITQHTHRHVGRHSGQLPQNVVVSPVKEGKK